MDRHTIDFSVGDLGTGGVEGVDVSVYGVKGDLIKSLFNGELPPGQYRMVWGTENDFGVGVAAGVYFVNMHTSKGFSQTQKSVVLSHDHTSSTTTPSSMGSVMAYHPSSTDAQTLQKTNRGQKYTIIGFGEGFAAQNIDFEVA